MAEVSEVDGIETGVGLNDLQRELDTILTDRRRIMAEIKRQFGAKDPNPPDPENHAGQLTEVERQFDVFVAKLVRARGIQDTPIGHTRLYRGVCGIMRGKASKPHEFWAPRPLTAYQNNGGFGDLAMYDAPDGSYTKILGDDFEVQMVEPVRKPTLLIRNNKIVWPGKIPWPHPAAVIVPLIPGGHHQYELRQSVR